MIKDYMKTFQKICFSFFIAFISINNLPVIAEITMDELSVIITKLKDQAIEPHKTYYQLNFSGFIDIKNSFPEKLFSSISNSLETEPSMYSTATQDISQVKLNDNYQYSDIVKRRRNIIEILYPSETFQTLGDGVHFYIFDQDNQLQKKENFEDLFELPAYLRVKKKNGKVVSIQKRPLISISHYTYEYWPNRNIKHSTAEIYDNYNNVIYFNEISYDEQGKRVKGKQKNLLTQQTMHYTNIRKNGVEKIEEYFDNNGIKTNHVIYYDNPMPFPRIENQLLNDNGDIINTITNKPEEIFDSSKYLDETYPYNSLIMDIEKTDYVLINKLFKHTFDNNTAKWDDEAIMRANYLGIKANQIYYHKLPYPKFLNDRYKNFPHQKPLTLIEAENQQPKNEYSDLIKVEIGDNLQYREVIHEVWQQRPVDLTLDQFKSLENGIHFFEIAEDQQLKQLDSAEQAIERPSYIRVERVMGKIISVIQKTRIIKMLNEYEYESNNITRSQHTVLESPVYQNMIIETKYESGNCIPNLQELKNANGIVIRVFERLNKENISATLDKFNDEGIKTQHIELIKSEIKHRHYIKTQFFDGLGNVLLTIDESKKNENNKNKLKWLDNDEPQPYDNLPFIPDTFETVLLDTLIRRQLLDNNN